MAAGSRIIHIKGTVFMAKRSAKERKQQARSGRTPRLLSISVMIIVIVGGVGFFVLSSLRTSSEEQMNAPVSNKSSSSEGATAIARQIEYEVVSSYPHDTGAFLQGLLWHEGHFYESTGLNGRSTLRQVEFSSGKVLKSISLSSDLFGEGLALVDDRLIQLTWHARRAFIYDRESLQLIGEFTYDTEGWGLTFDGKNLILSDGSNTLTYYDKESYKPGRKLQVTMNGRPLRNLNELEFIEGEIWANVWQRDIIVRIDPATGDVTSYMDMRGLLSSDMRTGREDVLNGIAYDSERKRIFVSGKLWPRVFEIKLKATQ